MRLSTNPTLDRFDAVPAASYRPGHGAVRAWLYGLAVLVVAMVAVGGATRLTGSGLSITEWRPVTGVVPPLDAADWAAEFDKYRDTPQFRILNQGIGLDGFKTLYWWEWGHRLLGRIVGLVFFLPFAWFWARGMLGRRLLTGLLGLGLLGGLQGAIGWIMVASGLQPGMTAVAPLKLALHLTTASLILAGLVWLAAGTRPRALAPAPEPVRVVACLLPALVLVQIWLGGLVAGSKAGLLYNTWPDMDGVLVPPARMLFDKVPFIENFIDNLALVQFNHRLFAYLVVLAAIAHAVQAALTAPRSAAAGRAMGVAALATAQMGLGIATLLLQVPLWAGLAHQVFAMAVLIMATVHARLSLGVPAASAPTGAEVPIGLEALAGRGA
ncbi:MULTISPECIES: COX15/CtaA family protein [Methylorubrum]|uniref:COX15/CtaA family protein n=1 Tax=Methylorubrum TaxID=2282523 RepID=UPI00209C8966|nr:MULTISPECIES: COX15/CtaA family protein [Methylorubrum]MCP1547626.1 cytochrome c oxidase assembly protein subunit 15 [Methylorubrum zatmanii]MCP1555758.1 cytochrome c oxidase assembly protein subunit 15 [Methylorubrum extorquens]MCP1577929.1 cytochrome c oxidase assembly protein subunit 15 [Methylorubrum extorquens]